ncbi:hypothetical protein Pfo_019816 [Paulownia fortunei]|nr:hypothetical protein Pfo_019816 [Paulownia fortunei]
MEIGKWEWDTAENIQVAVSDNPILLLYELCKTDKEGKPFSLKCYVLLPGSIDALNVQPFERFEEEERKKLHDYCQLQQQIGSLNNNPQINSTEIESHGSSASAKADEDPPIVSEYSGNQNNLHIPVSQGHLLPSASDVWSAGDVHVSIYHSTATSDGFASTQELSLGHPQFIQKERAQILDLERDRQDEDAQKDMLHRQSDDMSFFSSYTNQDRNELLQSFFKDQSSLSFHLEQKHSGLEFQPGNDLIMEAGQFPGHMEDHIHPSLPLDLRQKRLNDLYMRENFQENMYSDGSQYTMPRQEHLPVNVHDWATANTICVPAPSQPLLNSGELSQNWYMGENGAQDGWPCFEGTVGIHSLSSGSNSDLTLFRLLSECLAHFHSISPRLILKNFKTADVLEDKNFIVKVADAGFHILLGRFDHAGPSSQVEADEISLLHSNTCSLFWDVSCGVSRQESGELLLQMSETDSKGARCGGFWQHIIDQRLDNSFTTVRHGEELIQLKVQCVNPSSGLGPAMSCVVAKVERKQ